MNTGSSIGILLVALVIWGLIIIALVRMLHPARTHTATTTAPSSIHQPVPAYTGVVVYAGFWRRLAASLIDGIITSVMGCMFWGIMELSEVNLDGIVGILSLALHWLYYTLLESSSERATVGKMALGIVVTDMHGRRISFGRATGRYFGKIVSWATLCIGFLMAGFTEKKQALHDMMAGCLVIEK